MGWRRPALLLCVLGFGLIGGSLALASQDVGSCPGGVSSCDHTGSVFGTTIWLGRTAMVLLGPGLFLLMTGFATILYDSRLVDRAKIRQA